MGELSLGRTKGGLGRLTEVVSYKKSKGLFTWRWGTPGR